jgi:hypothetical protein
VWTVLRGPRAHDQRFADEVYAGNQTLMRWDFPSWGGMENICRSVSPSATATRRWSMRSSAAAMAPGEDQVWVWSSGARLVAIVSSHMSWPRRVAVIVALPAVCGRRYGWGMSRGDLDELRDIVRADLDHLRDTWHWGMGIHAIRREAPVLRRLLVDNGGDIARLWRAEDRPGQPMIPNVFDLDRLPNFKGLKFGTTETPIGGGGGKTQMGWMFVWEDAAMTPDVRQAVQQDPPPRVMSLRAYLEATCVVADEKPIRRDDLICYVANRRGGNHLDRRSRTGNPRRLAAYDVLDHLGSEGFQLNRREAAFSQLVSIVHSVVNAPDLQSLGG